MNFSVAYKFVAMKILIFLVLITTSEQRLCISRNNYFNFSTLSFNTEEFENTLALLKPTDNNTAQCRVKITFSYTEHRLEVIFNPDISENFFTPVEQLNIRTTFILDSDPSSIINVLIYNCSIQDGCERDFILDRLPFLLDQDYMELKLEFIGIFFEDEYELTEHIKDLSTSEEYFDKYCATILKNKYAFAINRDNICDNNERKSTTITITIEIFGNNDTTLKLAIFYICLFYGCNDYDTIMNVYNIVKNSSDVFNIIYGTNITKNFTSTTKSTTTNLSNRLSTTNINNSAVQHFQILSILISNLIVYYLF